VGGRSVANAHGDLLVWLDGMKQQRVTESYTSIAHTKKNAIFCVCVRGAAARLGCDGGGRKLSVFFVGGTVCRARVAAVGSCRAGGERVGSVPCDRRCW
jgi:hypothetical protein